MAEAFVELGAEGFNHLVENHWEKGYDKVAGRRRKNQRSDQESKKNRNQLPSPERERDSPRTAAAAAGGAGAGAGAAYAGNRRDSLRSDSLERQSETSERVTRAYENERDDPIRPVKSVLPERTRKRDSGRMSHANGYAPSQARPGRDRYDDDDGSDYDDREGRRYRQSSGRGYDDRDDRDDRDYPYDREIIETERYRGPARPYDPRRMDSSGSRGQDGPYGAGAMAPYRRSQNDVTEVSRRSRSRGRRDKYDRGDRDRSYSESRSRSRSRGGNIREKLEEHFDTSQAGIGAGLVGAVIGGLAGRQYGQKHKNRDILIGAVVGGLGANLAEHKYKDWKEERKEKAERDEGRWEGRSRSAMR